MRYKYNINDFIFFNSLLFVGGDLLSFKFLGLTIRFVNILVLFGFFIAVNNKNFSYNLSKSFFSASILLLTAMTISIANSYDPQKTLAYIFWFLYYIFILIPYYYYYAANNDILKTFRIWIITFRFQILLLLIEAVYSILIGDFDRPHIWFYEPSYAAIYLALYFGLSLYLNFNLKSFPKTDLYISSLGLLILISATALFAVLSAIIITILISKNKIYYIAVSFFGFSFTAFILYILIGETEYYHALIGFLDLSGGFSGLIDNIMFRSGTRSIRLLWGWDAFINYPFTGIGFGADQSYTKITDIPENAQQYVTPWILPGETLLSILLLKPLEQWVY